MKKKIIYAAILILVSIFAVFSCSKSCKKNIFDYIPGLSQKKEKVSTENETQKILENISFSLENQHVPGVIDVQNSTITVDLKPDVNVFLDRWELAKNFNSFEYEVRAQKNLDGIIDQVLVEKYDNPIQIYQVIFTQKAQIEEKPVAIIEEKPVEKPKAKKKPKAPIIRQIELRDLNGNTVNATLRKGKVLVEGAKSGDSYQIIELALSDLTATSNLNVGDYWQIDEEIKVNKGNLENIYVLKIAESEKPVVKSEEKSVAKPVKTEQEEHEVIAAKPKKKKKPVQDTVSQDQKSDTNIEKNQNSETLLAEEKPTKKKKSKKTAAVDTTAQETENPEEVVNFKKGKILMLSLQNENGQTFEGKLDTAKKVMIFEIPNDLDGKFMYKNLQVKKGYVVTGLPLDKSLSSEEVLKPSSFLVSNKKSEQAYELKVVHPADVKIRLKTNSEGFIGAGDLMDTLRLAVQKEKDEEEMNAPKGTKIKSKAFTGMVQVYLQDELIYTAENIKAGKKEVEISLDTLHQLLIGSDKYLKEVRFVYIREGIELGETTLIQSQYEIRNAQDLSGILLDLSGTYKQMNDIVFETSDASKEKNTLEDFIENSVFQAIGDDITPFLGKYDGQNFNIKDFEIQSSNTFVALFAVLGENAHLQNIILHLKEGVNNYFAVSGGQYTAGLLAASYGGIVENCHVMGGNIQGNDILGGLIGYNGGIIIQSSADVFVRSKSDGLAENGAVGGLVGFNYSGTIDGGKASNTIEGNQATFVGGLVGKNTMSIITSSQSFAKVSGTKIVGGFIGMNEEGTISSSTVESESVSGEKFLGGFIGKNKGSIIMLSGVKVNNLTGMEYVGGFIGQNENATIVASFANAGIRADKIVGGFIGENIQSSVQYSYAISQVYVNKKDGAEFIGINRKSDLKGCFASGELAGPGSKKHFIANSKGGNISDTYFLSKEVSKKKQKKNTAIPVSSLEQLSEKMTQLFFETEVDILHRPTDEKPFTQQGEMLQLWWEVS